MARGEFITDAAVEAGTYRPAQTIVKQGGMSYIFVTDGIENPTARRTGGSGFPGRPSPADMTECSALTPALLSCRHRILGVAVS